MVSLSSSIKQQSARYILPKWALPKNMENFRTWPQKQDF